MGVTSIGNRRRKHVKIVTQNCRGLKTKEGLQLLAEEFQRRQIFAAALQETWRKGSEVLQHKQTTIITHGPAQQKGRGRKGVAIVLSCVATAAWQAGGSKVFTDDAEEGGRVMAIRMECEDAKERKVGVFLVAAYAPVGAAPQSDWDS